MKKFFAMLSVVFFSITLIMMMSLYQAKTIAFVDYLFDISVFTPIFFNVLGIVSACFSPKRNNQKNFNFYQWFNDDLLCNFYLDWNIWVSGTVSWRD